LEPSSLSETTTSQWAMRRIGLWLGPTLFGTILWFGPPEGLSLQGLHTAAMTVWMAVWWITEAVPIPATSLLPLVILPISGVAEVGQVARNYSQPIIFLFIGGFMVALAVERWDLHRRLALAILLRAGTSPSRLTLGFMIAAAFLSMWISNTATAMLLAPMVLAILDSLRPHLANPDQEHRLGTALLLGVAYACSIGGVATLIGTPPNLILAAALESSLGIAVSFVGWMAVATPLAALGLAGTWWYLVNRRFPMGDMDTGDAANVLAAEQAGLGRWTWPQKAVATVISLVAISWIVRPFLINPWLPMVDDAVIALGGALSLFLIPSDLKRGEFLMNWEMTQRLPWGLVFLFGGGLAIANGFATTGLSEWLVVTLGGLGQMPGPIVLLMIVATVVLLTEVASNTASATLLMPVMVSLAPLIGYPPAILMTSTAVAASCAFMLPVATPPNAIVFGTGRVSIRDMVRAGIWMNVGSVVLIGAVAIVLLPFLFGRGG